MLKSGGCTNNFADNCMSDCNPKAIPCELGIDKVINEHSKELADAKLYREIVGSLIYLMTGTRLVCPM